MASGLDGTVYIPLPTLSFQPIKIGAATLSVPEKTKQFLISPPASPPVGWEQAPEAQPCVDFTLVTALASLQLPGTLPLSIG